MSLESHSIDDLHAEIVRRQEAERTELRRQLADLESQAAAIRAKLGIPEGTNVRARKTPEPMTLVNHSQLLVVLRGKGRPTSPQEIGKAFGVSARVATASLAPLLANGEVRRIGEKRGTRYELVGKPAVVVD